MGALGSPSSLDRWSDEAEISLEKAYLPYRVQ